MCIYIYMYMIYDLLYDQLSAMIYLSHHRTQVHNRSSLNNKQQSSQQTAMISTNSNDLNGYIHKYIYHTHTYIHRYIIDLASTNGSFLNGERMEANVYYRLKEADTLRFAYGDRQYRLLLQR